MNRIDTELEILNKRFEELENEKKRLLKNQFKYQDFFAQSIYRQELKDGTISKYPKKYFETKKVKIKETELWAEKEFQATVNEWNNKVPKLKFISIGNYIFFFKAIFFREPNVAIDSVNLTNRMSTESMKRKYHEMRGDDFGIWDSIEKYLYLKGKQIIEIK